MDIALKKKRGFKKKHIPYVLGGLLLVFIAWIIAGDHSATLKIDSRTITVGTAEQGQFNDYVRINGQVLPKTTIQLGPLEGGLVERKVVEEGATVKKGDVIVILSNSNLSLSILDAEAQLAEKQNFLRNTQVEMERTRLDLRREKLTLDMDIRRKKRQFEQYEKLYEEKLVAREEYLKFKEDYELSDRSRVLIEERQKQDSIFRTVQMDQMEESLDNMRRNMTLIRQRVDNLQVKSPTDGELGQLDIELGQSVGAGQRIGQISDLTDFKVEAQIDEHYIDKVRSGLSATYERQGHTFSLVVKKVYPEVRGGQFKVDFHFVGERPDNIRRGTTYYINLELGQPTESVIIPRGAFYQKSGGSWIFVVSPDGGKAFRRPIKIGRQNPLYYEVLEGLDPGEKVIVSSYETYGDNEVLLLK